MASVAQTLQAAVELHQAGDIAAAENRYRDVLRIDPQHGDALHLIGVAVLQRGKPDSAIDYIRRAIAVNGNSAPYHSNLAAAYRGIGDLQNAASSLRNAVRLDPQFADGWYNLGTVLQETEQDAEAADCFRQALRLNSKSGDTYNNLGITLQRLGSWEDAVSAFRHAIAEDPMHAEAHDNLGTALQKLQYSSEAIELHRRALTLRPEFTAARFNLGNAYRGCDRLDEAESCYRQVLSQDPNSIDAWNNLGIVLKDSGRYTESLDAFDRVLQDAPDHVEAHVNRSYVRKLTGDLHRGWPEFEWRLKADPHARTFPQPRWSGESLRGRTIFVHAEQGIGDEIMFASCLPDIAADAKACLVECDHRLIQLFERSFAGIEFFPATEAPHIGDTRHLPPFDVQISSGSVMQFVRRGFDHFPERQSYLSAAPEAIRRWKQRYQDLGDQLKVGISWRGGRVAEFARRRSMPLSDWNEIFTQPAVRFVNLQYGDCREELEMIRQQSGVTIFDWDDSDPLVDLDDFAAKVSALDLVISIDNSTVHIAGALGVPTWTLLPYAADWRWFLDRDDSPWYPSMRLYRQQKFADWKSVANRVAAELVSFTRHRRPTSETTSFPLRCQQ